MPRKTASDKMNPLLVSTIPPPYTKKQKGKRKKLPSFTPKFRRPTAADWLSRSLSNDPSHYIKDHYAQQASNQSKNAVDSMGNFTKPAFRKDRILLPKSFGGFDQTPFNQRKALDKRTTLDKKKKAEESKTDTSSTFGLDDNSYMNDYSDVFMNDSNIYGGGSGLSGSIFGDASIDTSARNTNALAFSSPSVSSRYSDGMFASKTEGLPFTTNTSQDAIAPQANHPTVSSIPWTVFKKSVSNATSEPTPPPDSLKPNSEPNSSPSGGKNKTVKNLIDTWEIGPAADSPVRKVLASERSEPPRPKGMVPSDSSPAGGKKKKPKKQTQKKEHTVYLNTRQKNKKKGKGGKGGKA